MDDQIAGNANKDSTLGNQTADGSSSTAVNVKPGNENVAMSTDPLSFEMIMQELGGLKASIAERGTTDLALGKLLDTEWSVLECSPSGGCGNSFYDILQCNGAIARTTTILFSGGAKSTRRKQQNTECTPIFSVFNS
jgi:hypothetical protein